MPPRQPPRADYTGPPAYASPPRWGFPALAWRWPTSLPGAHLSAPPSPERVRLLARPAVAALWALATFGVFAALAEGWRYLLLLRSREGALARHQVITSDALVIAASLLAVAFGLLAALLTVWWLLVVRRVAADTTGHEPARPDWQLLLCLAIPGVNLSVAGSALAELEHAVLRRPAGERPKPGRLVLVWWSVWAVAGVLFALTVAWRFRDGVQADADGVLLTAATDLAASVVAVLTSTVVLRVSALVAPMDPAGLRFMRVVRVSGAPDPPLRSARPAGSVR